jgi:hypothetical protein
MLSVTEGHPARLVVEDEVPVLGARADEVVDLGPILLPAVGADRQHDRRPLVVEVPLVETEVVRVEKRSREEGLLPLADHGASLHVLL